MDPEDLHLIWRRSYTAAATTFFIAMGSVVAALVWLSLSPPDLIEAGDGWSLRLGAVILLYAGATVAVGTGLVMAQRWAAVLAALWCIAVLGIQALSIVTMPDETVLEQTPEMVTCGSALVALLLLVVCSRAALAKKPPESVGADRPQSGSVHRGEVPESTSGSPVAGGFILAGLLSCFGGIGMFVFAIVEYPHTFLPVPKVRPEPEMEWVLHDFPEEGFAVKLPAKSGMYDMAVKEPSIQSSRVLECSFHALHIEIGHLTVKPLVQWNKEDVQAWMDQMVETRDGKIIRRSHPEVRSSSDEKLFTLMYEAEMPHGNQTHLLAVARGRHLYIIYVQQAQTEENAARRVIDSFELTEFVEGE